MNNSTATWAVKHFAQKWFGHPISFSIITIAGNMVFVGFLGSKYVDLPPYILVNLAVANYVFSGIVLAIIFALLCWKKNVLYNMLDVLLFEVEHRIHVCQEVMNDIKIGMGHPYEEVVEWLCPGANPIKSQTRKGVVELEFLTHLETDCGLSPKIDNQTNLALAKYYYKDREFEKAIDKIEMIKCGKADKGKQLRPCEVCFCKGLILSKLGRHRESLEAFHNAANCGNEEARCWECYSVLNSANMTSADLQEFLHKAEHCPRSLASELCINKRSTAYYKKAKLFSPPSEVLHNLQKAVEYADLAISRFNSWPAYYNKACDLSLMLQHHDKEVEAKANEIYVNLKEAFKQKAPLIRHSVAELDLKWFKEHRPCQYYQLLGDTYSKHFEEL